VYTYIHRKKREGRGAGRGVNQSNFIMYQLHTYLYMYACIVAIRKGSIDWLTDKRVYIYIIGAYLWILIQKKMVIPISGTSRGVETFIFFKPSTPNRRSW